MNDRERLNAILRDLDLPRGQWVLSGSGTLVLRGIERPRPMGDVDIFVATRLWVSLLQSSVVSSRFTWSVFTTDPNDRARRCDPPYLFKTLYGLEINIFMEWRKRSIGNIDVAHWIHNAEEVDGWPCVPLQYLYDWKCAVGRDKDLADIRIIEATGMVVT